MSIWFFVVLVVGVLYALNRLTSTTDLPVSTRLARAREIAEGGKRPGPAADAAGAAPARRACAPLPTRARGTARPRRVVHH